MNVRLYVSWSAVSSEEQVRSKQISQTEVIEEDKASLRIQLDENRKAMEKHGYQLYCELVVDGSSRDIVLLEDAREQVDGYIIRDGEQRRCKPYAELHRLIREKAFDVLAYLDLGRLGRDMVLSQSVVRLCHRAGIITYSTKSPPASMDKPQMSQQDYLLHAIGAVGYQEEISEIKRRNAIGMVSRVERGDFAYRVPWPWIEKKEGKKRWIEVDEKGQAAIRLFVDLYTNRGCSLQICADELTDAGYTAPEGGPWTESSVQSIANNIMRYAGETWVNKNSLTGRPFVRAQLRWQAIITKSEAQAVEDEQYQRFYGRGSVSTRHRFSMCVYCVTCGARMGAQYKSSSVKKKVYPYERYICPNAHAGKYIQAWRIDEAVAAHIDYWSQVEDIAAALPQLDDRSAILQKQADKLTKDLERHRQRLDRVDDALADGAMELDSYRRQVERIKADIARTQEELDTTNRTMLAEQRVGNRQQRIEEIIAAGRAMLNEPDIGVANAFFRRLVRVYVEAGRVVAVETP